MRPWTSRFREGREADLRWLDWLRGRKDQADDVQPAPRPHRESERRLGLQVLPGRSGAARHMPPGKWVRTTAVVSVEKTRQFQQERLAFASAVQTVEAFHGTYGLLLEPEPDNPHDPNAIRVFGKALGQSWHIGYLDRATAVEINRDLVATGIPIAAELYDLTVGERGETVVRLTVLAPPGHSMRVRLRQRKD